MQFMLTIKHDNFLKSLWKCTNNRLYESTHIDISRYSAGGCVFHLDRNVHFGTMLISFYWVL